MKLTKLSLFLVLISNLVIASAFEDTLKYSGAFKINQVVISNPTLNPQFDLLDLSFVIDSESIWANSSIMAGHLKRIERSLNSCRLTIGEMKTVFVSINEARYTEILKTQDVYKKAFAEIDFFEPTHRYLVPTTFLLKSRKIYAQKAFAVTQKTIQNGVRINQDWGNLTNTAFVTDDLENNRVHPNTTPSFSVISHEVAHLIGELAHVYENGNLMSSSDDKDSKDHSLNNEQCIAIRNHLNI